MGQQTRRRSGFTLIELMIVVAIIGVLASMAIPNYLNMLRKAKSTEAQGMLKAIYLAERAYFNDAGEFLCSVEDVESLGGLDYGAMRYSVPTVVCGDPYEDFSVQLQSMFPGPSGLHDIWAINQRGILVHLQNGLF